MPIGSRIKAFVAYLFFALGAALVLLFSRKDQFAVFHARQSLILTGVGILSVFVWVLVAYPLAWIPYFGPVAASATFGLVIAAFIALAVGWIMGMVNALRAETKRLPMVGNLVKRWR